MKKRILSMLLAIVMVVGTMPGFALTASAADTGKTVLEVENGTVEFDATNVSAGDRITVTVKPDDGYVVNTARLGRESAAVYVSNNTFTYVWYNNDDLVGDFALIRGYGVYFNSDTTPIPWDKSHSRVQYSDDGDHWTSQYMLETGNSGIWYATIPDGATKIYFMNYMPGQPEELVSGGYQETHIFEAEANKTYTYSSCTDTDNDHSCDSAECSKILYELCSDADNDHYCDDDVCGAHLSWLCADEDNDHFCDICYELLTDCYDMHPVDFKCDVCGYWMLPDLDIEIEAEAGDRQITVTWNHWDKWNEVAAVYHDLSYTVFTFTDEVDSYAEYSIYNIESDTYAFTITDLENDVTYTVGVEVSSDSWTGYSIRSGTEATPYSTDATVPGAPENVAAVAGPEQITVSWTAPENNGGAKILGYKVECAPKGAEYGNGGGVCYVDADTTSVIIEYLSAEAEYEIKVCAFNAVGDGDYSAMVSAMPIEVVWYDLWIYGNQVNSANAADVLGDGTVSYNAETCTLILTDASLERDYDTDALIYCGTGIERLTIKGVDTDAVGNNSICIIGEVGAAMNALFTNLVFEGSIGDITGSGMYVICGKSITVAENCEIGSIGGAGTAVYGEDFVTILGNVGNVQGDSRGIVSAGDVSILGKTGTITGINYDGIRAGGTLTVSGTVGKVTGKDYGLYTDGLLDISAPIEVTANVAIAAGGGIGTSYVAVKEPVGYVVGGVEVSGKDEGYTTIGTEDDEANFTPAKTVVYAIGYEIEIDDDITGGTVWTDDGIAAEGSVVNVYVVPDDGLSMDQIIVKDESGAEIPVTKIADDICTYMQPAGKVTIEVTFKAAIYMVTWSNGNGGEYVKFYTCGEIITVPDSEYFAETMRKSGYNLIGWTNEEGYQVGDEMPAHELTFTAVYEKQFVPTYTPAYPPTVNEGDNGDVYVSPEKPEIGSVVVITPHPDDGYEVDEVIVTDKNGNPVEVIDNGDGTYGFRQPIGNVSIEVTFKKSPCPGDSTCLIYSYSDLDASLWYYDSVHYCIEHGLMQGVGNKEFDPNGTTTRAMIVTILWRLEGSPAVNYAMDFEDVAADRWYTEAIRWAASEKIVEGYGDGKFGTNDAITRAQMVTILFRYAEYKGCDVSVGENTNIFSYGDAFDVAEWAIPAMKWACGSGMIRGIADGSTMNLAPQGDAARAQTAAILQRYVENVANKK